MAMMDTVREIIKACVRKHAKGSENTDAQIDAAFRRTIPGTIAAACEACATGVWKVPPERSRAANMAARRLAAAMPDEEAVVPPKKTTK